MTVKFRYNDDYGLQIEADDGDELTTEQAQIVAMRDMAWAVKHGGEALWHFAQEFEYKKFFDDEAVTAIGQAAFALAGTSDDKKKQARKKRVS